MIKNLIFDFDGTLINTNDLIILSLNETAKKFLGRQLLDNELNSILGYYIEDQMKKLSPENYKEMVLFYNQFYDAKQDEMVKDFPGVRNMLRNLKQSNYNIAIMSAKERLGIDHGIKLFKLEEYMDVIISASDVKNNKPHPEPALIALHQLDAAASESLIIGDSPLDIKCGRNAGIKTVLVGWTIFPMEKFKELEPDAYLNDPSEIETVIRNLSENY